MVKYNYDENLEAFKRADNRGNYLWVNVTEAQRIQSLLSLGYPVVSIETKVSLSSPKASTTTVKSFIRNYKAGNIEIPEDAPAPVGIFNDMVESNRLDDLEKRVEYLENLMLNNEDSIKESFTDKVKLWLKS